MNPSSMASQAPRMPADPGSESVAGEEDPGASLDMAHEPAEMSDASAAADPSSTGQPFQTPDGASPGDEAPPGTPGTGESICRDCGGSGQVAGSACKTCEGTGKVTAGLGGG